MNVRRTLSVLVVALALSAAGCAASPARSAGGAPTAWAQTMLMHVNAQRAAAQIPPVGWCGSLARAAQAHSADQAAHDAMSHTGSDGSTLSDRADRAGYSQWTAVGENVAYGYSNVSWVIAGWMGSSGHRANILSPTFTHLGAGLAYSSGGRPYWTQDFGRGGTC